MAEPVGERHGSGGPYEDRYGYSRVVRVGPFAMTAGCTAVVDGAVQAPGDAGAQAAVAFGIALESLARIGVGPECVVATRMSIIDAADADAVGSAHFTVLGQIRPVATMVIVAGLIDPAMLVEIELTAWVG